MANRRKKQRPDADPILDEVDRFLEGGVDALSPAVRRHLGGKRAAPSPADTPLSSPQPAGDSGKPLPESAAPSQLELMLLEKGLKAVVRTVYPHTSPADILDLLTRHRITFGIDRPAILKAVETTRKTGQPQLDLLVARGKPAQPPQPPRLDHCLPEGLESLPSLDPIRSLLALRQRDEIVQAAAGLQAWAVGPGDRLAVQVAFPGKEGVDLEGRPIPLPEVDLAPPDPRLQPGQGVRLAANNVDYLASTYGYAGLENGRVSVLEPLWISPDSMEACFLKLTAVPGSRTPGPDDLRPLLKAFGVVFGTDEEAIATLCRQFASQSEPLFTLARGEPSQPPLDSLPTFHQDLDFRVGAIRQDGSIDFRERNIFPSVEQGTLLAEYRLPAPGRPGHNVRGEELPVSPPLSVELVPGENVRLEQEDGLQRLYAEVGGGAALKTQITHSPAGALQSTQYTITVQPVGRIDGDVGYETGNIDFQGNVEIRGSVRAGFHVRATGDLVIAGSVEAGAVIQAGGDLMVRQGIVGQQTAVQAGGSLTARYVHDASLKAGGDVVIDSYLRGAQVTARGRVQVEGRGGTDNNGGIIGGQTWGLRGITSRNVGSERSATTQLFAGLEPAQRARSEKLAQTIRQAELMLQKLLKAIGLPALRADEIRRLVARNPGRRSTILHYIKKANQLVLLREQHLREQRELAAQIAALTREATIDIQDQAFARTTLHIGDLQVVLTQDLQHTRFAIDPKTGKIAWQDLG